MLVNFGCPLLAPIGNLILIQSNVENGAPHMLQAFIQDIYAQLTFFCEKISKLLKMATFDVLGEL